MLASTSSSRRTACKTCRDRKVRCDGDMPSCTRCVRAGETCVYVLSAQQTKAELVETVDVLRQRLDKMERRISGSRAGPVQVGPVGPSDSSLNHFPLDDNSNFLGVNGNMAVNDLSDWLNYTPLPSPVAIHNSMAVHGHTAASYGPVSIPRTGPQVHNEAFDSSVGSSVEVREQTTAPRHSRSSNSRDNLPSLKDMRKWNTRPPQDGMDWTSVAEATPSMTAVSCLESFVLDTMLHTSQISGIAASLVELLCWARSRPTNLPIQDVINVLQARLHEVIESTNLHREAVYDTTIRKMLAEGPVLSQCWKALVDKESEQLNEGSRFFTNAYDLHSELVPQWQEWKEEQRSISRDS